MTDTIAQIRELIADIGPHQTDTDALHAGITVLEDEIRRLQRENDKMRAHIIRNGPEGIDAHLPRRDP